jgi:SM-20-related protein
LKINIPLESIPTEQLPVLEKIIDDLVENGFTIIDDLLLTEQSHSIKNRLLELKAEDEFKKSGIGKAVLHQVDESIRGDFIRWIETDDLHPSIECYYQFIENFIAFANRSLYLNLKDLESHYTFYPPGKGYLKHRDRFREKPHRVLSMVYYLNENWQPGDGGELDIFDQRIKKLQTIAPRMNRLVVFKSEMVHEVLPSIQSRYSLTTWLLDKEKELSFL